MKKLLMALAASLVMASAAQAATFTGEATVSSPINKVNPGLLVRVLVPGNSGPQGFVSAALDFALDVGDSFSTDLFVVRTFETVLNADDLIPKAFALLFSFGQGSATITGTTYAQSSGANSFGVIDFDGPAVIALGGGENLVIELTDAMFNTGPLGFFIPGKATGALIAANFTLAADQVSAVPLPASLPLALGALAMLGYLRRRHKVGGPV